LQRHSRQSDSSRHPKSTKKIPARPSRLSKPKEVSA
jgi:hypothetical protein